MMDERKIKDAVNSINMPKEMENRLKMKSQTKREKLFQFNFKKWVGVASAVGVLVLLITYMPFISKFGNSEKFTITAYANDNIGHELLNEITTLSLSNLNRALGLIASVTEDGKTTIFYDIMFTVSGENIDSIEYKINKGMFIEDVILTAKEAYDYDWQMRNSVYHIIGEPGSDIHQGIKRLGSTFTVKYNEQEELKYSLAIPSKVKEDIVITVTVTYTDGTTEQQDIIANLDAGMLLLLLEDIE